MAFKASARALMVSLIWPLLLTPAVAQESAALADADSATSFHLTGVLVSRSGRSALVNGSVFREGDRVAGAEILTIREGEVQLLVGSRELTIRVGADVVTDRLSDSGFSASGRSRQSPGPRSVSERSASTASTQDQPLTVAQFNSDSRYGPVKPGETLSEIAERHLVGDVSLNQMMIALFDANPLAFGGNINLLLEGATLHIPNDAKLRRRAPEAAAADVMQQMDAWQNDRKPPTRVAHLVELNSYGPVVGGETLSAIAASVARHGATMNQTMMALFHANPQAFDGNINVMHEGAVLRIPDNDELHGRPPAIAAAEVVRHMQAWQTDSGQPLQSARTDDDVNAPRQETLPPSDGVLLSMTSSE